MSRNIALAVVAHPDDIEFMMAGTLLLLKRAGWQTHYLNVANGDCGSIEHDARTIATMRRREAQAACRVLGAVFHPSLARDLQVLYTVPLLRRVAAVIREVHPRILLVPSPQDYMEDHTNTCRLAVTAAFAREAPNFQTTPRRAAVRGEVTLYHGMPQGLRDPLRRRIIPGAFVNTTAVHATKREALACHASQKGWLDVTQGMGSYLRVMEEFSVALGRMSGCFQHAEGWRRHMHYGFCAPAADPLREALGGDYLVNERYERGLEEGVAIRAR